MAPQGATLHGRRQMSHECATIARLRSPWDSVPYSTKPHNPTCIVKSIGWGVGGSRGLCPNPTKIFHPVPVVGLCGYCVEKHMLAHRFSHYYNRGCQWRVSEELIGRCDQPSRHLRTYSSLSAKFCTTWTPLRSTWWWIVHFGNEGWMHVG
jgi:hypothetical protein